jgi:hypothetical protein
MRDVLRLVARGLELRGQRRRQLDEPFGVVAPHEALVVADGAAALVIGDGTGVPHENAARMHDQKRRDRELDLLDVGIGEAIARGLGRQHAAVEHIESRGRDVALSLEAKGRHQDECGDKCAPQYSAKHRIPPVLFESCARQSLSAHS